MATILHGYSRTTQYTLLLQFERYVPGRCVNRNSLFYLICRTFEESMQPEKKIQFV